MIYIKTLTITSNDFNSATLAWEFTNPKANTANHHLEIYRSESPAPIDQFTLVAGSISPTAYSYTDTTISGMNLHQFNTFYYRIKVVDTDTPTEYEWSTPSHLAYEPDLQAKRMLKHKRIGLKKYGKPIKILKKRIHGTTCSCFDLVLQRSLEDDCPLCNGTGIQDTGGYYDPIIVDAAFNDRPKHNEITPFGLWQPNDSLLDIMNYPILEPDDVIVDDTNRRWKVKQISTYSKGMALISQRCAITLQERTNQVYDIEA